MKRKNIKIDLFDSDSIENAVEQLNYYKKDMLNKCEKFVKALAEVGVECAKIHIEEYGAIDTSELYSSLDLKKGDVITNGAKYIVYTDCYYAKFVEFGTGIRGMYNQHPYASDFGWEYDVNEHGEGGWIYTKNGTTYWTNGYEARPYMLETLLDLQEYNRVKKVAKQIWG